MSTLALCSCRACPRVRCSPERATRKKKTRLHARTSTVDYLGGRGAGRASPCLQLEVPCSFFVSIENLPGRNGCLVFETVPDTDCVGSVQNKFRSDGSSQGWRGRDDLGEGGRIENAGRGLWWELGSWNKEKRWHGGTSRPWSEPPPPRGFRSTATPLPLTSAHLELARPHFSSCRWDCELWLPCWYLCHAAWTRLRGRSPARTNPA